MEFGSALSNSKDLFDDILQSDNIVQMLRVQFENASLEEVKIFEI